MASPEKPLGTQVLKQHHGARRECWTEAWGSPFQALWGNLRPHECPNPVRGRGRRAETHPCVPRGARLGGTSATRASRARPARLAPAPQGKAGTLDARAAGTGAADPLRLLTCAHVSTKHRDTDETQGTAPRAPCLPPSTWLPAAGERPSIPGDSPAPRKPWRLLSRAHALQPEGPLHANTRSPPPPASDRAGCRPHPDFRAGFQGDSAGETHWCRPPSRQGISTAGAVAGGRGLTPGRALGRTHSAVPAALQRPEPASDLLQAGAPRTLRTLGPRRWAQGAPVTVWPAALTWRTRGRPLLR